MYVHICVFHKIYIFYYFIQADWWYGSTSNENKGWFPKSYVKEITISSKDIAADGLNEYYVALYRYDSSEAGDLNFNQGEVILVIKKEGDWWTGCIGDKSGIFPSNYVEKCDAPNQVYKSNILYIYFFLVIF